MRKIKLLREYDDHPAGEIRICHSQKDADTLVGAGIAEYCNDADDSASQASMDEIVAQIRRQLKLENKSGGMPFAMGGATAEPGWGRMSPKDFWLGKGETVSGGQFNNAAEYLKAIAAASKGQWDNRLKDLTGSSEAEGAFLVPTEMANFVWMEVLEDSPFFTQATLLPMSSNKITIPYVYDVDRSSTGMHGIEIPHGKAEGSDLTDISPTFDACELSLKKIGGRCRVSNEMLEDSAQAMSTLLPKIFSDALSFEMQRQFLNGTGVAECLGIVNCNACITVTKQVDQDADTLLYENIVQMWNRMLPSGRKTAIWMCNIDTEAQLRTMAVAVGTAGSHVFALNTEGAVDRIFGKRVYFTELLPTVGDEGDIIVFNPQAYALGRKVGSQIRIEVSEHARFENDQTVYRAIARLDGQPLQSAEITPAVGSTLSNFVKLEARD